MLITRINFDVWNEIPLLAENRLKRSIQQEKA